MSTPKRPSWAPDSVDLGRPNAARIYDYLLGGAANFEADRVFAEKLLAVMPEARHAARTNRAFLRRVVRFCAEAGVRQFLDVGSGIPTVGNVHEVARAVAPDSRVLYVDNEPVAAAHGELMLRDDERAAAILGDLTDPDAILRSDAARRLFDLDEPVAVLMLAVLHFIPDDAGPHAAVARYTDAMAPGSYLALTHAVEFQQGARTHEIARVYRSSDAAAGMIRSRERITAFFAGLELVEPGLVWTPRWRPESPEEAGGDQLKDMVTVAGVGRKP